MISSELNYFPELPPPPNAINTFNVMGLGIFLLLAHCLLLPAWGAHTGIDILQCPSNSDLLDPGEMG